MLYKVSPYRTINVKYIVDIATDGSVIDIDYVGGINRKLYFKDSEEAKVHYDNILEIMKKLEESHYGL